MRYRKSTIRYATVIRPGHAWPLGQLWQGSLQLLPTVRWRPDADVLETVDSIEVIVDVAGIAEEDFDITVFEDAVVVEGERRLPTFKGAAVYHTAAIPYGPFRVELSLPVPIQLEAVEAQYRDGLLRISLPKRVGKV